MGRVGEADLAAEHDEILERGRTGNADLTAQQTITPYLNVVTNMDKVIKLGAPANDRIADRAPVNADIRADFHVIPNGYGAK